MACEQPSNREIIRRDLKAAAGRLRWGKPASTIERVGLHLRSITQSSRAVTVRHTTQCCAEAGMRQHVRYHSFETSSSVTTGGLLATLGAMDGAAATRLRLCRITASYSLGRIAGSRRSTPGSIATL